MTNKSIYNDKVITFMAEKQKQILASNSLLSDITITDIKGIINEKPVVDFLEQHLIIDGKLFYVKDVWLGQYIQGQSVKTSFSLASDIFDNKKLDSYCANVAAPLIAGTNSADDAAQKKYLATIGKMRKAFIGALSTAGLETVSNFREAAALAIETDLMNDNMKFEIRGTDAYFKIPFKLHDASQWYCDDSEKHIDQFAEHFTDVREVTEWVCANRFAPSGWQDSYLHIQAPSGFGKSNMFIDIWKNLGYGHETTLKNISSSVSGGTGGESARSYVQAAVIFIDEETGFAKELKNIANKIKITEKFKSTIEVPIFAKIFTSKEDPTYLMGKVGDSQVIGRFARIDYIDTKGRYDDFLKDTGYNSRDHINAIKWLIASSMNKWAALYREDRLKCEDEARKVINAFTAKFGLRGRMKTTSESPEYYGEQFLDYISQQGNSERSGKYGRTLVQEVQSGKYEGKLFCSLTDYKSLWKQFCDAQLGDESFAVRNSKNVTRAWVLLSGDDIRASLNGKQQAWCIFRDPVEVKTVGSVEDFSVEDEQKSNVVVPFGHKGRNGDKLKRVRDDGKLNDIS